MLSNKTGILLCNIGTPDQPTTTAVRRYLREFLSDRRVVELPRFIWWPILHGVILRSRPKKSAALYQKIWEKQGSPLLIHCLQLKESLQSKLQIPIELGMHYGSPSIQSALESLQKQQVEKILILPLYPQYSAATTASSFDKVADVLKKWRKIPELHLINDYAENESYIQAIAQSIQTAWEQQGKAEHLLFSFHGIPKRFAEKGDPYPLRCHTTVNQVAEKLNLTADQYSISFQSRLGRAEWLTPYTDKTLIALAKQGIKKLQVVCPGFAVDCLETLEEIAIQGKKQFLAQGGESFHYIPALNASALHIDTLFDVVNQSSRAGVNLRNFPL